MTPTAAAVRREPELLGQTVVVIGGSAGIGLETARRARAEGADVILTGRNPERLEQAALELGVQRTAAFDATDPAPVQAFFQDLPTPIDHVMVTAGAPHYAPPLEMTPEEARGGLTEHLLIALEVARAAGGKVRPPGSLVFMGGTGARRPRVGLAIASTATVALPHPHRQPRARARADPRQPDRRGLRRHPPLGIDPRRRPRQAARRAPRHAAHPARRRTGRRRRAGRSHHDQHGTHRRDVRHRRRPAARLVMNTGQPTEVEHEHHGCRQ